MTDDEPNTERASERLIEKNYRPVTVFVYGRARLGMEEELRKELMVIAPLLRANPSCLDYRVYQHRKDPTKFVFYERWVSEESVVENLGRKYMEHYNSRVDELYESRTWDFMDEVHPVEEAD